jgi:crossover junction endodeoxyribonuclease RuvC
MPIILGIDPGSRVTGFGVIHTTTGSKKMTYVASGCIRTIQEQSLTLRLGLIYEGILEIIENFSPNLVAVEQVFLKHNVMSALKLGHARGAALAACAKYKLDVSEYAPRAIKQSVVGFGAAEKTQVQQMIVELLQLNRTPQADASDALAVAVCHGFHSCFIGYKELIK